MSERTYMEHIAADVSEIKGKVNDIYNVIYVGNGRPPLRESQADHDKRLRALEESAINAKRFWLGVAGSVLASGVVGVVSALATVALSKPHP